MQILKIGVWIVLVSTTWGSCRCDHDYDNAKCFEECARSLTTTRKHVATIIKAKTYKSRANGSSSDKNVVNTLKIKTLQGGANGGYYVKITTKDNSLNGGLYGATTTKNTPATVQSAGTTDKGNTHQGGTNGSPTSATIAGTTDKGNTHQGGTNGSPTSATMAGTTDKGNAHQGGTNGSPTSATITGTTDKGNAHQGGTNGSPTSATMAGTTDKGNELKSEVNEVSKAPEVIEKVIAVEKNQGRTESSCTEGSNDCGENGTCVEKKCVCRENWSGEQCEILPGDATRVKTPTAAEEIKAPIDSENSSSTTVFFILGAIVPVLVIAAIMVKSRKDSHDGGDDDIDTYESSRVSNEQTVTSPPSEYTYQLESRGTLTTIGGSSVNLTPKNSITMF